MGAVEKTSVALIAVCAGGVMVVVTAAAWARFGRWLDARHARRATLAPQPDLSASADAINAAVLESLGDLPGIVPALTTREGGIVQPLLIDEDRNHAH